jgi:hypothetical protein
LSSSAPTIIFLHIGKTGGSSLRPILRRQFRRSEVLEFRAPLPTDGRLRREGALDAFARLPEADRARARLVMGHTPYGLHELIPRPSTYVTMLRDPERLVVSLYHYIRRTPRHILHDRVVADDIGLEAFVTSGLSLETDNSQLRAITGDTVTPFGGCDEAMLEEAKRHVEERFSVAGLTERFDESVVLLGRAFGWTRLYYLKANVAPSRDRTRPSAEAIELIRRQNSLDIELYRWVADRLDERIAADPSFSDALAALRRSVARYRPVGVLTEEVPRKVVTRFRR